MPLQSTLSRNFGNLTPTSPFSLYYCAIYLFPTTCICMCVLSKLWQQYIQLHNSSKLVKENPFITQPVQNYKQFMFFFNKNTKVLYTEPWQNYSNDRKKYPMCLVYHNPRCRRSQTYWPGTLPAMIICKTPQKYSLSWHPYPQIGTVGLTELANQVLCYFAQASPLMTSSKQTFLHNQSNCGQAHSTAQWQGTLPDMITNETPKRQFFSWDI